MNKLLSLSIAALLATSFLYAQQIENTNAKPTDWEEVNFETNQSIIADGFPSLLRLADLLKTHPTYKVNIVGHADQRGSTRANDALSLRRAEAVSQFLQKYGATAAQIQTSGEGKKSPEVNGRDKNALFVNRRVVITVTAPDGMQIGDGSINSAIEDFITYARTQLGKMDALSSQIQQVQTQVGNLNTSDIKQDTNQIRQDTTTLKSDTAAIKQDTAAIKQDTGALVQRPPPLTAEQTTQIAHEAADYALTQEALRNRKYSLVGGDIGPMFASGRVGDYSAEIFGKALIPFGNGKGPDETGNHGFQVDGDWVYSHTDARLHDPSVADGLSDAIFDVGLVNRFGHVELGTFAQFDYASMSLNQYLPNSTEVFSHGGAFLGGGVVTVNYVVNGVSFGVFGAKGFKDTSNVTSTSVSALTTPQYIRYADQAGFTLAATYHGIQMESSLAYVKRLVRGIDEQPSGMLKLSFGPRDNVQFFVEGDVNTTLDTPYYGDRVVFGVQFGNWVRARNYGSTKGVTPVTLPRPHYELLSR
jgi:hypothetical protein